MEKIDLYQAIAKAKELPVLPQTIAQLLHELQNPDLDIEELSRDIALDQAITAKILRLVNSSFYGMPGQIGNLNQAVVILGLDTIKNVVLTIAMVKAFKLHDLKEEGFVLEDFWRHTIATGLITQALSKFSDAPKKQDAFVAGLLHDIGKLLLLQAAPEGFKRAFNLVKKDELFFWEAERKVLSADHTELGAWLGKKWHFPVHLQEVMYFHHRPEKSQNKLVHSVHIADALAIALGIGSSGCTFVPKISRKAWDNLGLSSVALRELLGEMEGIFEEVGQTAKILLE